MMNIKTRERRKEEGKQQMRKNMEAYKKRTELENVEEKKSTKEG